MIIIFNPFPNFPIFAAVYPKAGNAILILNQTLEA